MGPLMTPDSTTTHANLIPAYYERLLLETFEAETKFYGFGTKNTLAENSGKSITWNRRDVLAQGYVLTEGTAPSNQALATTKVSALIRQFGLVLNLAELKSFLNIWEPLTAMAYGNPREA